jgi:peptidoglycan/xylan/chitin deacetylase (PgdA/CDA1 family)
MNAVALMYHDVVGQGEAHEASGFPGADAALYKLNHDQFALHLCAIAAAAPVPPARVFDLAAAHTARAPWLITFDDGGVSAYTHVADLLEEHGWRGHFFVTTGRVGTPGFMSRAQIRALHERGHVIGSHSHTHPLRMARCTRDELLDEWGRSITALSEIVGAQVRVASVPGGMYTARVARAAAQSGVEFLFTSEPVTRVRSVEGCAVLGRYGVWRGTPPETAAAVVAGRRAPRLRQLLLWNAKKLGKVVGGEYYLKVRQALIDHK